tara:strand:- start:168 stop:662 length:495 start_codon:yes stop_codon:yes gene_type:complete
MKKIIFLIISIILFFYLNACAGYKPIYGSSNFNFVIEDHSIKGEERLANSIYKNLYNISLSNKNNSAARSISLTIETTKERRATVKNSAGKILEYEINLNTHIIIKDFLTDKSILNQNFNYTISYKVQDAHSDTLKLENKNIDNLIDKTYQDALVKISEVITSR